MFNKSSLLPDVSQILGLDDSFHQLDSNQMSTYRSQNHSIVESLISIPAVENIDILQPDC